MATTFQQNKWSQKPPSASAINRGSPQAKGLIGYWPVLNNDNNRLRNLVSAGDALSANGWKKGGGLYGPSALLNGSTQRFTATGNWPANNLTFSCRLKFNAIGTGTTANSEIFQRDNDSTLWGFQMQCSGPKLQFYIVNQVPAALNVIGNKTLVINTWYHIAASYNLATTTAKLYVNGVIDNSASLSATSIRGPGTQWTFGSTYTPDTRYFNGYMEDLRIYDRALLDAEVLDIYRNPMSVFINQNNIMYASAGEAAPVYNKTQFFSMF